jgi:hypothetical protein
MTKQYSRPFYIGLIVLQALFTIITAGGLFLLAREYGLFRYDSYSYRYANEYLMLFWTIEIAFLVFGLLPLLVVWLQKRFHVRFGYLIILNLAASFLLILALAQEFGWNILRYGNLGSLVYLGTGDYGIWGMLFLVIPLLLLGLLFLYVFILLTAAALLGLSTRLKLVLSIIIVVVIVIYGLTNRTDIWDYLDFLF